MVASTAVSVEPAEAGCAVAAAVVLPAVTVPAAVEGVAVPVSLAWSAASLAWAVATVERSWASWASRPAVSSWASTCPAATCWPGVARTLATRPASAKLSEDDVTEAMVPIELIVSSTLPRPTTAVR